MKLIATLIATMFAVSAFAADAQPEPKPAVTAPAAPHKTDKKAEVTPTKSDKKEHKKADTKAATAPAPAAK